MTSDPSTRPGPAIEVLHHRLQETPESLLGAALGNYFYAFIHDAVYKRCPEFGHQRLYPFRRTMAQVQWYPMAAMIAYFISEPAFDDFDLDISDLLNVLEQTAQQLAAAGNCELYRQDVDRREEFIRVILQGLRLRPSGETESQAEHRLQTVSSAERLKVLQASRAAEERARAIREELARKRAQEAADKMTRE